MTILDNKRLAGAGLVLLLALGSGCGVTRKVAVSSFVPILNGSVDAAYRDQDVETVREAIPGNLILLRGLVESDPGRKDLRELAVQLYFSYSQGFIEDDDPARAALLYAEGLRLGRDGLEREGWFRRAEASKPLPDPKALSEIGRDDVPLLVWTLANWMGWIGLELSEPAAVAQLPRVQAYLERVIEIEPDFFFGLPHVLAGTVDAFRPRMLGGNPERAKEQFEDAFRISGGKILLYDVYYARYYCRQILDEECFTESLTRVLDAPDDLFPEYRLLNEIAREKAARLMEMRDDYF